MSAQNGGSAGFDSGLQNSVQWTLNVTNDQIRESYTSMLLRSATDVIGHTAIYFFCKAPTHCGLGMVGYVVFHWATGRLSVY